MKFHRMVAIAVVALPLLATHLQAAELKVFATMSVKSSWKSLDRNSRRRPRTS